MDKEPLLDICVLVTREEYSKAFAEMRRKERSHIAPLIMASGTVLMILGIAGAFFGSQISLSLSAAFCLILLGIFLVCYDSFFAPLFDSAEAAREFDEKEDLQFATNYSFSEDTVMVNNGRISGNLPLKYITRWNETPTLFIFSYGREFSFAVPKRLLSEEQNKLLSQLLKSKAAN